MEGKKHDQLLYIKRCWNETQLQDIPWMETIICLNIPMIHLNVSSLWQMRSQIFKGSIVCTYIVYIVTLCYIGHAKLFPWSMHQKIWKLSWRVLHFLVSLPLCSRCTKWNSLDFRRGKVGTRPWWDIAVHWRQVFSDKEVLNNVSEKDSTFSTSSKEVCSDSSVKWPCDRERIVKHLAEQPLWL